jgi:putative phosphoribosyl transferase
MGVDEIICAQTPEPFMGVGMWYRDFSQTTDEEVREILARSESLNTNDLEDRELVHT